MNTQTATQTTTTEKGFMAACREFFGLREGQTALSFGKEVQALTREDKMEIREGLAALGMSIAPIA